MKSYTLKKIVGAPNWEKIPTLQIDTAYKPTNIRAWAQLCWDDTCIHVHLQAEEEDIRNTLTGPLDEICTDSCLEFFIRPTEALSYFNIEFNLNCAVYLGYGTDRYNLVRLIPHDHRELLKPVANTTQGGWEITYQIPFTFIQQFLPAFDPKEGYQFYGNCYKCGDEAVQPHHLSWSPIEGKLDFHTPQFFGRLILGGE